MAQLQIAYFAPGGNAELFVGDRGLSLNHDNSFLQTMARCVSKWT